MEKFIGIIKAHPIPIAVGVIILLLLMRGSSSSGTSSNIATMLQSQQISGSTNVALAGIGAQSQAAKGQQNLELTKAQLSYAGEQALARTSLLGEMFSISTNANTAVTLENSKGLTTRTLAGLASADNRAALANNLELTKYQTDAGVSVASKKIAADLQANATDANTALSLMAQKLSSQERTLPLLLQSQENIVRLTGQNSYDLATITTEADRVKARASARSSDVSAANSIANTVMKFWALF